MPASLVTPIHRAACAPALHIPDGFLSMPIALALWLVAGILVRLAVRRAPTDLDGRSAPLMGVMAAFIFAAQMINFPVPGGTSGHLLGGVLAAAILGPWSAMLVMTAVIALQALLFQDGGLLAMGANMVNMGLAPAILGFGLLRAASGRSLRFRTGTIGIAAWISVVAGALLTSLELWMSNTAPLRLVMPAMLSVHALIGVGEALITVAAVGMVARNRPDLVASDRLHAAGGRAWAAAAVIAVGCVLLLAPLASIRPDGLERVAQDLGFSSRGHAMPFGIMPDYAVPILGAASASTLLAGAIGAAVVAGTILVVARRLGSRPKRGD